MKSSHLAPPSSAARTRRTFPWLRSVGLSGLLGSLVACTATIQAEDSPPLGSVGGGPAAGGPSGVGSSPSGVGGGSGPGAGGQGNVGVGGSGEVGCTGDGTIAAPRIVRLSFNQVANSIATLVDRTLGTDIVTRFELVDAQHRAFPPLQSPREGNSFTDDSWAAVDQIAQAVGEHAAKNINQVTGCGDEPTDACAQEFLAGLAKKAYRRPLTADESSRLSALYTEKFKGIGATTAEAIQYSIYAIFQSPHFLYRTEWGAATGLSQLELASALSYFITDDTPDEELLGVAERGELTGATIGEQVDRILKTDAAKVNLKGALISYFAYPNLESQVIQDDAFDGDMRRSMFQEAELFLDRKLWSGPVEALVTSKSAYVDANLAPIYGISAFPPAGATPVQGGFYEIELPGTRTGLLTQAGFLANRSRPDHTSVVGRGLLVKSAFLCTETPPPSEAITEAIEELQQTMPDASEREMADLRAESGVCAECHSTFDAYGLALDTFDVLGRYRTEDDHGRPIDPTVTLPEVVGGGEAKDIVEVANRIAESGAFARCMGQNLLNYAFSDVSSGAANIDSCAVQQINDAFAASDGSFSSLVKAVATSKALSERRGSTP
jgi:Protein of unknown function (DUF1588)/Protein of unknown function (DUF1592)/Protein of unknown function (DUF1595)/Protein of unknown function (DUF1585)